MNFEREAWRPLFLRESVSQRGWNLVTRGLRVYLIRVAEDDGTLLKRCTDPFELAANLAVHPEEVALVRGAITTLLHDGFLHWDGDAETPGRLGVDRLVKFGASPDVDASRPAMGDAEETAGERRRRLDRERKRRGKQCGKRAERSAESSAERSAEFPHFPLSPPTPPSLRGEIREDKRGEDKRNTGGERRCAPPDPERARAENAAESSAESAERSAESSAEIPRNGGAEIPRTYTMPSVEPPKEYLDEALMDNVSREQAISTWRHYYGAGLPERGVERLHHWLAQRAKERANALAKAETSPKRVSAFGQAPRQPDAGKTGFESLERAKP